MRTKGLRDKYPSFFAMGDAPKFLSKEEAPLATTAERVASVWPFLVRQVMAFQRGLKARQRANYDPEDTLQELYLELTEKDSLWNPERGRYLTFVGTIVEHKLYSLRDKAHTVQSPRNSVCRLRQYQAEETAGNLSAKRKKTAQDIRRSIGEFEPVSVSHEPDMESPDITAIMQERYTQTQDAIADALRVTLTTSEARVIGALFGLWGQKVLTVNEVAFEMGLMDPGEVRRIRDRAKEKLGVYLGGQFNLEPESED